MIREEKDLQGCIKTLSKIAKKGNNTSICRWAGQQNFGTCVSVKMFKQNIFLFILSLCCKTLDTREESGLIMSSEEAFVALIIELAMKRDCIREKLVVMISLDRPCLTT